MSAFHRVLPILVVTAVTIASAAAVRAERNLLAYPSGQSIFRYDPARYEVVGPTDSKFHPSYALADQTLWDKVEERVAVEIYRAPGLSAFAQSVSGFSEYFHSGSAGLIVVDGFSSSPRRLSNIYVQFTPRPATSVANITVNGAPVSGLRHVIPYLEVATPTGDGNYSDEVVLNVEWSGPLEMEVIVYVDRDGNRIFDGEHLYSILMQDSSIPTEQTTWGKVKSLYGK